MEINEPLENFIESWYWDEKSHQYAQQLGLFIFDFIDDLSKQNLSKKLFKSTKAIVL